MGIIRNLDTGEILEQLIKIKIDRKIPITNIVFMGMGEPFLNYNNVIKSCSILNDSMGFNLSSKKITISTSGILPKINQFIEEKHKFKLAISLNASNNKTRSKLIPINKKWPIESILSSIKKYKYSKYRPIMFEYILINEVNDSPNDAKELAFLLNNINCKINIIPYNQIDNNYKRSEKIDEFVNTLKNSNNNLRVFIRWSKGQDINAACGQLVTQNEKNNK
jgi:23S rRNA (adenine2503-C2)-methyltransferase